jgi:hypothetical protein
MGSRLIISTFQKSQKIAFLGKLIPRPSADYFVVGRRQKEYKMGCFLLSLIEPVAAAEKERDDSRGKL